MKILIFQNFDFTTPTLWCIQARAVQIYFFDLGTPFGSQRPGEGGKNTEKPNEFTDSQNFAELWVAPPKTIFAMKPLNHLGVDITLETIALRFMYNKRRNAARQRNSRQRGPLSDSEPESGPHL